MKFGSLLLRGTAVIAVFGSTFVSLPLTARASDVDERITTRDLNAQQLDTPSIIYAQSGRDIARPMPAAAGEDMVSLDAVAHPRAILTGRVLVNRSGEPMGRVEHVVLDDYGRPIALEVDLDGYLADFHRMVRLDAGEAYFDQYDNVIKTDLTRSEVKELPRTYPD